MTWASCRGLGADDWIVVAQQSDESDRAFTQRVRERVRRLRREDAQLDSVDVFASPNRHSAAARREVIAELSSHLVPHARLTLWSVENDAAFGDVFTQLSPFLAEREIELNHRVCDRDERSGVRHAVPPRFPDSDSELEQRTA